MTHSFEDKVAIVASAFHSRFDEEGEPEILQKIFDSHDLAGAIELGVVGGDVEIKSDEAKGWIEESYNVLNAIFDFPEELGEETNFKRSGDHLEQEALDGNPSALGDLTWQCLIDGEFDKGIEVFERFWQGVQERSSFEADLVDLDSVKELLRYERINTECNFAMLLLASGKDTERAHEIFVRGAKIGHHESRISPILLKWRSGEMQNAVLATKGLPLSTLWESIDTFKSLSECENQWVCQWGKDGLSLLKEAGVVLDGTFVTAFEKLPKTLAVSGLEFEARSLGTIYLGGAGFAACSNGQDLDKLPRESFSYVYLGYDCWAHIASITLSSNSDVTVGIAVTPYGPWTSKDSGSEIVGLLEKVSPGTMVSASLLLEGLDRSQPYLNPVIHIDKEVVITSGADDEELAIAEVDDDDYVIPYSGDLVTRAIFPQFMLDDRTPIDSEFDYEGWLMGTIIFLDKSIAEKLGWLK